MAEVTVSQLAKTVGATVDRLLAQMREAGLDHESGDQVVSDDDKQTLLAHLKSSHGASTAAPKKITLKRRTIGTAKTSANTGGKKTVAIEVRKKRTYVKREEPAEVAEEVQVEVPELETAVAEEVATPSVDAEVVEAPKEVAPEPETVAEETAKEPEAPVRKRREDPFDVEEIRRRAATKRREQEEAEQARHEAVVKAKAEQASREKAEEAARIAREKLEKEQGGRKNFRTAAPATEDEPKKPGKKKGRKGNKSKSNKNRGFDEFISDDAASKQGLAGGKVLQAMSKQEFQVPTEKIVHEVRIGEQIAVSELAQQMALKANAVIRALMKMGVMASINEPIDQETAILVVEELGHTPVAVSEQEVEDALLQELQNAFAMDDEDSDELARPPVVTVMGHVDHGKTSLLDYIRESRVASGEAGGITQHIGAYHVETNLGVISFLDTPGHAAFTAMRARGAECTDIVILVVAADDGVMPQTIEAIQHAKAAEVPLVVAVNKIDKESADPERVKNELVAQEVIPEDWGGDTQFIHVSAHTGEGIDKLLEAVSLQAEVLELTAPVNVPAKGVVIESRLDKGRGNVASILVQEGELKNGDIVLAGLQFGRVRNMSDERGQLIEKAGPSIPVEILGLDGTPNAGDEVLVVGDERKAREVVALRREKERDTKMVRSQRANLDNLFASFEEEEVKNLNIIVKSDVRGSAEAIVAALEEIGNDEVQVNIVSSGVGAIVDADVNLAAATSSVIFGFNVRAEATARKKAENESIELRYYSVIYNLLDDVKDALSGMLAPEKREEILGTAEVREVFKSPKFGLVAGCMVVEGTVLRNKPIRVLRDSIVIHEGELDSLRRFKDDVSEVRSGTECGIGVKDYTDVKAGDMIEVFDIREIKRSL